MARAYKKRSSRGHKRGLKPGHKKSPAWRKAISEALKRYHRGRGKGRKHKTHRRRKTTGRKTTRRHKSGTRKKRVRYLTHSPKTGKSYF